MNFRKVQTQQEIDRQFEQLNQAVVHVVSGRKSPVTMQLVTDYVFNLCYNSKELEIIGLLKKELTLSIAKELDQLVSLPQELDGALYDFLKQKQAIITKICSFCNYLDMNFCRKSIPNEPLKMRLIKHIKAIIFDHQPLLESLGKLFHYLSLLEGRKELKKLVDIITKFDNRYQIIEKAVLKSCLELHAAATQRRKSSKAKQLPLAEYLDWAYEYFIDQQNLFLDLLHFEEDTQSFTKIKVVMYDSLVSDHSSFIATMDHEALFRQHSHKALSLFELAPSSKHFQDHMQWFIGRVRAQMDELDSCQSNNKFLHRLTEKYFEFMKISSGGSAEKVSDEGGFGDITCRTVFALQEWVSSDKKKCRLRLNSYIHQHLLSNSQVSEEVLKVWKTVFILLKEKDLFLKQFKLLLIKRVLVQGYTLDRELPFISVMKDHCGMEWTHKVQQVLESGMQLMELQNDHHYPLRALSLNTDQFGTKKIPNGSFQDKSIVNQSQRLKAMYLATSEQKKSALAWHPIMGRVVLGFSDSFTVICNTFMANLLLRLEHKGRIPLAVYLNTIGLAAEEVEEFIKAALASQLIRVQGQKPEQRVLQLNYPFIKVTNQKGTPTTIDLLNQEDSLDFSSKTKNTLTNDNKMMVEALIVRVVKKAGSPIPKEEAMQKLQEMISAKGYLPNAQITTSALERLLDRQFIREHENGTFTFVA